MNLNFGFMKIPPYIFACLVNFKVCGKPLKAAIMGRYSVGGSGPVCKTGAYYARMVRAHLSPPIRYGRVAQLEEHRKIIDSCKNS